MFGRIGPFELILILCIALVVFGPSKLPQVGKSMGQAIKEFRKGCNEVNNALDPATATTEPKPAEKKEEAVNA